MSNFENMEDLALALGDGGPHNPDVIYKTNGEVVDALIYLGNSETVFARHDDHLGLPIRLSDEFLRSSISDNDNEQFQSEINAVLEQANIIFPLAESESSEDE